MLVDTSSGMVNMDNWSEFNSSDRKSENDYESTDLLATRYGHVCPIRGKYSDFLNAI
jgi:hypothetical protein